EQAEERCEQGQSRQDVEEVELDEGRAGEDGDPGVPALVVGLEVIAAEQNVDDGPEHEGDADAPDACGQELPRSAPAVRVEGQGAGDHDEHGHRPAGGGVDGVGQPPVGTHPGEVLLDHGAQRVNGDDGDDRDRSRRIHPCRRGRRRILGRNSVQGRHGPIFSLPGADASQPTFRMCGPLHRRCGSESGTCLLVSGSESAASGTHTGLSPVWPDAHRVRKSAIMNTPAFSDSTHESVNLPDKPALEGLRDKWDAAWSESEVYAFDSETDRGQVYSIDTPPPTASGSLHVGHVFSYTQTDIIARYQRMTGKNVFYPLGWDDNGLPTERRVQNYYGVT